MLRCFAAFCLTMAAFGQAASNTANVPATDAKDSGPASPDPLVAATALLNTGKSVEAIAAFKAIVEKNPLAVAGQAGLIRSLLNSGRVADATDAAKQALAVAPSSALIHAAAGDVHFRSANFKEAENEYRAALKIDKSCARATFGIARLMDMISMRKSANAALSKAHSLDPNDAEISDAWIFTLPRAQRAEAYKKSLSQNPTERETNRLKVLTAESQKQPWVLTTGIKPTELKMTMVGASLAWLSDVYSTTEVYGPMNIRSGYALQVRFNDRASADLLLDTGAQGIVIGQKLAKRAGVVKIADTFLSGIGDEGSVRGYVGWADKIRIGNVEFRDCLVEVSSKNDVGEESGLLGADVFDKFLITLDFREHKVILAPLPQNPSVPSLSENDEAPQDRYIAPEMQGYTKVFIIDDQLLAPVVANDKAVGNFMIDTGASINSMSPTFAAQVTHASNDHEHSMKGVNGKVDGVLTGRKAILQISRIRLESHDFPVFSTERQSKGFGVEIAGFIGIRSLSQMKMTIDYRDGLLALDVYDATPARE